MWRLIYHWLLAPVLLCALYQRSSSPELIPTYLGVQSVMTVNGHRVSPSPSRDSKYCHTRHCPQNDLSHPLVSSPAPLLVLVLLAADHHLINVLVAPLKNWNIYPANSLFTVIKYQEKRCYFSCLFLQAIYLQRLDILGTESYWQRHQEESWSKTDQAYTVAEHREEVSNINYGPLCTPHSPPPPPSVCPP